MFHTGVIGEVFMDKKYAQQQRILFIFLIRFISLQGFDDNVTGSGPVIHFVYIIFVLFGHKLQFTRLFLIEIFFIFYNHKLAMDKKQIYHYHTET